jgi:hypothetical protein
MPRFQVRVPSDDRLAETAREGGQFMADAGEGRVTPAKLVEERADGDGVVLTFDAEAVAYGLVFGEERYEVIHADG